jgi:hypothetical protein
LSGHADSNSERCEEEEEAEESACGAGSINIFSRTDQILHPAEAGFRMAQKIFLSY